MKILVLSFILILISGVTIADPILQMTIYDELLKSVVSFNMVFGKMLLIFT